jgi:signal transduction protein with GAF and PtsI domain
MVTSKGNVIGSFCVQGREERSFSEQDLEVLRTYAARAMERIETRRRAPIA